MLFSTQQSTALRTLTVGVSAIALVHTTPAALADESDRIDELERQIDSLKEELESVRDKVEADEPAATATDERVLGPREMASGSDQVRLTLSGQVNRGILITDDGNNTDAFFVDNDNSSTRVRLLGDANLTDDISVGSVIEVQFESNSTAAVSQDNQSNVGPNNFTERKLEVFADSKSFGRLWLGQGDTASNGTSEQDLSGVSVIGYSSVADLAGGIQFADGGGNLTGVTIGDTFSNLDGLSRDDRVRYDTPEYYGTKLSAAAIADDRYDIALRYGRKLLGAHEFKAAIAYSNASSEFDSVNGSASVLLGGYVPGVNLTIAAGSRNFEEQGRDDATFFYGKLGYLTQFKGTLIGDLGETGFAVDYYDGADIDTNGDESASFGLLAVQNVDAIGTEVYAGARNYSLDRQGQSFDDVRALLFGVRVKF
ncbi:MAG: hypothetical protein ACR2Q4_20470 [Geminicoccaceae bacterium]